MKVLEKGREQEGWSIETRCTGGGNGNGGCGALLLVEQGDLFGTQSHARDETTNYITFRCPECDVMTDLQNSDYGKRVVPVHLTIAQGVRHPNGGYCHPDTLAGLGRVKEEGILEGFRKRAEEIRQAGGSQEQTPREIFYEEALEMIAAKGEGFAPTLARIAIYPPSVVSGK